MASQIHQNLYRVSLDSERTYIFVAAKDPPDLIHFLVDEFVGSREIYGVKQLLSDGSLSTVPVITNPLYQSLSAAKLAGSEQGRGEVKSTLTSQIAAAEARQTHSASSHRLPSKER